MRVSLARLCFWPSAVALAECSVCGRPEVVRAPQYTTYSHTTCNQTHALVHSSRTAFTQEQTAGPHKPRPSTTGPYCSQARGGAGSNEDSQHALPWQAGSSASLDQKHLTAFAPLCAPFAGPKSLPYIPGPVSKCLAHTLLAVTFNPQAMIFNTCAV